ncbi:MAG TPA: NifB/NifX family molybdenum-iron cluster-binding protein [Syntrophomonadaceae bacterium]|nr:NifB/NifX family molybdenum-iron cluster-binding protein [Syntrophomonadaceae bacterium]
MKIAMPVAGDTINQHFGQSKNFLITSVDKGQIIERKQISTESLQHNHSGLSGLLIAEGVSMVILGGIGQPALDALKNNGLQVVRGATGKCEEVLEKFLAGKLADQNVTCNHVGEHNH